ncbi:hypothetical protein GCM10023189_46000 [Nibrella saemangeumensis]|uniref:ATP/ADP translocase n=1 Tax=Nibrella saemangeumensis TaxID=1084526 RepID=A0ABP8ND97_9BACT
MELSNKILALLDIRRNEKTVVFLLISYAFFIGFGLYMYYVAATSLFLTKFNTELLPVAYIIGGVMLHFIGRSNLFLQARFKFSSLSAYLLIALILSIAGLLLAYRLTDNKWIIFVLFLWIRTNLFVFSFTFWLSASRIFDLEQAKRIFSVISTGEVASSIAANLMVKLLLSSKVVSVVGLLYISLASIVISFFILLLILRKNREKLAFTHVRQKQPANEEKKQFSLFQNRYHVYVYLLALLPVACLYLIEFNFSITSKKQYPDENQLAQFLGQFLFLCSVIELLIKAFLYRFVTKTFGLAAGLTMLPIGLLLIAAGVIGLETTGGGVFFLILISRFLITSIRRSFSDTSFQMLFQPVPEQESVHLQNRVESYAKPLGYIVAGGFLLVLMQFKVVGTLEVYLLLTGVLAAWLLCALVMLDEYRNRLLSLLSQVKTAFTNAVARQEADECTVPADTISYEDLQALSLSPQSCDRLTAAQHLGQSKRYLAYKHLIHLLEDPDPRTRKAALQAAGQLKRMELWPFLVSNLAEEEFRPDVVRAMVMFGDAGVEAVEKSFVKMAARTDLSLVFIDVVRDIGGAKAVRFLRQNLANPSAIIRDKVYEALTQMGYKANFTEQLSITQEVDNKLSFYIWTLAAEVDLIDNLSDSELIEALRHERTEVLSKIFNLLTVMYGDARIDQLRSLYFEATGKRKSYLIEIVDMVLSDEMKVRILPIIGDVSIQETILKMQAFYPQQHQTPRDRLVDIVNKDPAAIRDHTRTLALWQLLEYPDSDLSLVYMAFAGSASEALAEAALYGLYRSDTQAFNELMAYYELTNDQTHLRLCERITNHHRVEGPGTTKYEPLVMT